MYILFVTDNFFFWYSEHYSHIQRDSQRNGITLGDEPTLKKSVYKRRSESASLASYS